jgi:hypothetical protein
MNLNIHNPRGFFSKKTATLLSTFLLQVFSNDLLAINNEPSRDPFSPTKEILAKTTLPFEGDGRPAFVRSGQIGRIPQINLRGIVNTVDDDTLIALLELKSTDNQIHVVRTGDEIAFDYRDPSLVIKIKEINRLSVLVEVGTLGDVIVVR